MTSPTRLGFERQVRDALAYLHDPGHLQAHPLTRFLKADASPRASSLGRALRQTILDAVESLKPSGEVPATSHASRSYQILRLRFVEGLEVSQVEDRLSLSKSLYYLELQRAVEGLSALLWERWGLATPSERPIIVEKGGGREAAVQARVERPAGDPSNNLPLQLTSFVGRERAMADVGGLLREHRLVTLTGTGGCGKTRLALEVAQGLLDGHPDGVWLVDLAPLVDPSLAPQTVASTLAVREQSGRPIVEALIDSLRARRLLLLLDNCEHLVDACAQLVETLLRGCPELRVLATSREPLGVPGEIAWRVPSLEVPDAEAPEPIEDLSRRESVRLLVERVRLVRRDFALTPENVAVVAEVCRRLDGMPLAIELTAARVGTLTIDEIARRLDDRFRLLTGGNRMALPRQQTLRGTLDWSHDLLSEPERVIFRRLATFAGGWTLAAAEAVCPGAGVRAEDVLDLLAGLARKSMVLVEQSSGETRYRLLDTIRQYAREKLEASGELDANQHAHAAYFRALVEQSGPELSGPREREWLDRLDGDRDNLRAALRWLEEAGDVAGGLRMAADLFDLWMQRGPYGEAIVHHRALLELPGARQMPLGVESLARLATFTGIAAGCDVARPLAEEAVRLGRDLGDRRALGWALWAMGGVEEDPQADRRYHAEALAIFREIGDQERSALCLWRLGQGAMRSGELALACTHLEESLGILRGFGAPWPIGMLLYNLAEVARLQGDLSTAWELADESLSCLREAGDRTFTAWPTLTQAAVLRLRGEHQRATDLAGAALKLGQEYGDQTQIAVATEELDAIAQAQRDSG